MSSPVGSRRPDLLGSMRGRVVDTGITPKPAIEVSGL